MTATQKLQEIGQSLWLDNITRDLLTTGTLRTYIDKLSVDSDVRCNPVDSMVPQQKVGFPIPNAAFCSDSKGQRRLGEKEYRAHSVKRGVALRVGIQAGISAAGYSRAKAGRNIVRLAH